ncbi:MAG: alanine racemase [Anaerolineae bacterium]|nr:alanine racemase [Anaerolineae bacterium]
MINLYHLLDAATGQLFGEPAAVVFPDFCADIRRLEPGQLYAALPTELGDGHRFIGEAIARGAAGVVCVDPPAQLDWTGVTCVVVHDIRAALLQWAVYALQRYGTTVIALAGADTAVAREAVARVLRTRYRAFKSSAPCRTRDDLPLALGRLEPEDQFAILELAGDVAEIVAAVGPMVGAVTGIAEGEEHRAGAYRALVEGLPPEGLAVLNYDDDVTRNMAGAARAPVLTFGLDTSGLAYGSDLLAYNIKPLRYRTAFDLRHDARRYLGRWIPLLGTHQLYGVLAGMLVGLAYETPIEEATQALTDLTPIRGRLCPLEGVGGSLLVDDTHDATVESTLRALAWLEQAREPDGRLIFVMGGIEAAGWARQNLRALGRRVGGAADVFVAQGHMAAQVGRAAVDAGMDPARVHVTFSPADSVEQARADLGPHDVVLVKGGASARMDQVVRGLLDDPARDAALVARPQDAGAGVQAAWRPSWVEVDLDAVAHNVRRLKAHANQDRAPDSPEVALMVVVRANAYGHGAAEVGTTAALNGADYLGVGSLEEGVRLREAGVDAPILVLGYTPGWMARQAIVHGLTVTLFDRETARAFDRAAGEVGATARVHVKVDTGLGRLGLPPDDVARFFRGLHDVKSLEFEGCTPTSPTRTPPNSRARGSSCTPSGTC